MVERSYSRIIVGIDPAQSGSIVALVLSGDRAILLFCVAWKKVTRQKRKFYKVDIFSYDQNYETSILCEHPAMISKKVNDLLCEHTYQFNKIIEDLRLSIAIEDAYVGRSAKTGIGVAKFAGRIVGVIEGYLNREAMWTSAGGWRKVVLDLPHFTKREECKKASIERIPAMVEGLPIALRKLGKLDHITDASGIALWSYLKK